jgi:hypothetical protein
MSYLSSAGIAQGAPGYGKTCRKNVLRGVDVPVVPGAAGRASPVPGGQAQVREQVPLQGFGGIGVDGEDHVPASVRLAGNDHRRRVERGYVCIGPGPHEPDGSSHLGQPQFASAHGERAPGIVRGLPGPAGLEPRVPGAPGEERLERSVLVTQRLLRLIRVRPAPVSRPHPYRIAHVIDKLREPRRTGNQLFLSHCAGRRPRRPAGQGFIREVR